MHAPLTRIGRQRPTAEILTYHLGVGLGIRDGQVVVAAFVSNRGIRFLVLGTGSFTIPQATAGSGTHAARSGSAKCKAVDQRYE